MLSSSISFTHFKQAEIELTTSDLVNGCIARDRKVQELLYRKYAAKIFPVCMKYCSCRLTAEDHLHDTFIEILSSIGTYSYKGSLEAWMKRIAINIAVDKHKKKKINYTEYKDLEEIPQEESNVDTSQIKLRELLVMIQKLPDQYRMVFNLYQLDGFTHAEISGMLGIHIGTSKSNLFRAKSSLRVMITEHFNSSHKDPSL